MGVQVFSNAYNSQESWSAQGAVVNWGKGSSATTSVPILMQQITISYQRTVQAYYPLNQQKGKLKKCVVTGPAKGTLQVTGIYAPTSGQLQSFITAVGKPCKTESEQITMVVHPFGTACSSSGKTNVKWTLANVELEQIQMQIQGGENSLVQMPMTFSFSSLTLDQAEL